MDRPFRRLLLLAVPLALAGAGCETPTVARGQVSDGPKAPVGLPPIAPGPLESPTAPIPVRPGPAPIEAVSAVDAAAVVQVKVVATVGGEVIITEDEVAMMVRERAMDYVELTGDARAKKEKEVYRDELRKLVERELVLHEFTTKIKKNKPQVMDELWERAKLNAEGQDRKSVV